MRYNPSVEGGGIEVQFEGRLEVETVSQAFRENAERLCSLGNDSSVSPYQKRVIEWTGESRIYKGPSPSQLLEPMLYFIDMTEEKVDKILDDKKLSKAMRIREAGHRYRLAHSAGCIIAAIEADPGRDLELV